MANAAKRSFAEEVKRWTLATSLGIHFLSATVALALALFTCHETCHPAVTRGA